MRKLEWKRLTLYCLVLSLIFDDLMWLSEIVSLQWVEMARLWLMEWRNEKVKGLTGVRLKRQWPLTAAVESDMAMK